uniref:Uncharacterized protein n=1 Tax=Daucus carota subsp. sativus TaxID=79200 RepID=A0A166GD61_DAUCS
MMINAPDTTSDRNHPPPQPPSSSPVRPVFFLPRPIAIIPPPQPPSSSPIRPVFFLPRLAAVDFMRSDLKQSSMMINASHRSSDLLLIFVFAGGFGLRKASLSLPPSVLFNST